MINKIIAKISKKKNRATHTLMDELCFFVYLSAIILITCKKKIVKKTVQAAIMTTTYYRIHIINICDTHAHTGALPEMLIGIIVYEETE